MTEHTHGATGVPADTAGVTLLNPPHVLETFPDGTVEATQIVVEQTGAADADWNITLDGSDLFSANQSVSAADTPERFTPEQNEYTADELAELAVDVRTVGSTGTVLNITVTVEE